MVLLGDADEIVQYLCARLGKGWALPPALAEPKNNKDNAKMDVDQTKEQLLASATAALLLDAAAEAQSGSGSSNSSTNASRGASVAVGVTVAPQIAKPKKEKGKGKAKGTENEGITLSEPSRIGARYEPPPVHPHR